VHSKGHSLIASVVAVPNSTGNLWSFCSK